MEPTILSYPLARRYHEKEHAPFCIQNSYVTPLALIYTYYLEE